jgi:hypothetical protein
MLFAFSTKITASKPFTNFAASNSNVAKCGGIYGDYAAHAESLLKWLER